MSVTIQVLVELKSVLKEDAGLELNVSKTSILPKVITQQTVFDVTHSTLAASPVLTQVHGDVSLVFVRNFVPKTGRVIIDDVEKLDAIQDGFVHYQLVRFCQDIRPYDCRCDVRLKPKDDKSTWITYTGLLEELEYLCLWDHVT
jgi:hypothetical protein